MSTNRPGGTTRRALLRGTLGAGIATGIAAGSHAPVRAQQATPTPPATPVPLPNPPMALGGTGTIGDRPPVPIDHIIVVFMENHAFDNLYGLFPGANGLQSPGARVTQVAKDGTPYATLPPVVTYPGLQPDPRFPTDLPNAPFALDPLVPLDKVLPSPIHRFYQHQLQVNGGRMDRFVAWNDADRGKKDPNSAGNDLGAITMGYVETTKLPLFPFAREFTLCDNYFSSAWGGSLLNHIWLVSAGGLLWPAAPEHQVAVPVLDDLGNLVGLERDGNVTPDGHCVNDVDPWYPPYGEKIAPEDRCPVQTSPTIGDRLSAAGIPWAWYAGGWDNAAAGRPDKGFVPHHQPFNYFAPYGPGLPGREHLQDESRFMEALSDGTLPAVCWIKPLAGVDEHAGSSPILASEEHTAGIITAVQNSPLWERSAIIVTYDDFGGWFDHVPARPVDRWGPGGRVPALVVSPWARKGHVESTPLEHCSILRFIEWRFGLAPLTARDALANNLLVAFDFDQRP